MHVARLRRSASARSSTQLWEQTHQTFHQIYARKSAACLADCQNQLLGRKVHR